jgi:hypothetical protein
MLRPGGHRFVANVHNSKSVYSELLPAGFISSDFPDGQHGTPLQFGIPQGGATISGARRFGGRLGRLGSRGRCGQVGGGRDSLTACSMARALDIGIGCSGGYAVSTRATPRSPRFVRCWAVVPSR